MNWTIILVEIIALSGLLYFFVSKARLDKGFIQYFIGLLLILACIFIPYIWITRLLQSLILFVYLIFYDENSFKAQIKWFVPLAILYFSISFLPLSWFSNGIFLMFLLWGIISITMKSAFLLGIISVLILLLPASFITNLLTILIMIILDQSRNTLEKRFEFSYDRFQRNLINEQYQEIKNVYLQMRGWRHDYHNHIQTMKAYLAMNELNMLDDYFSQLQTDLDSVDMMIKSGNVMMDAILNSKVTMMNQNGIRVICKAILSENLSINDIDLCVIVGNLLDNAIEACREIPEEKRFIRIYAEIAKSQFYLSIQNSATEEINFNQRNYISSKRGEHGFGIKRVSLLVDKYDGYLNLQNEPGIFASEITIPIN